MGITKICTYITIKPNWENFKFFYKNDNFV